MKIYIKSSKQNNLTLAKGVYFDYFAIPYEKRAEYSDFLVDNNYIYGYLFISEAEYDIATGTVSGNLLNHEEILRKYHLENVPSSKLTYFRIDLNSSKTGTALTTSGVHLNNLNEYLSKLFNVSIGDNQVSQDWISCDSPDFSSIFKQAAARCQNYIYELKRNEVTDLSDYNRPDYFAFCFAVVDPETNSALISDSPDGVLFASPSYDTYLNDAAKLAKELGKSSRKDLSFKTLYYKYAEENKDIKGPGTEGSLINQAQTLVGALAHKYPSRIDADIKNRDITLNGTKDFHITVDVKVAEPEFRKIGTDYFEVKLPQDFKANDANLKLLHTMMCNA